MASVTRTLRFDHLTSVRGVVYDDLNTGPLAMVEDRRVETSVNDFISCIRVLIAQMQPGKRKL